MCSDVPPESIQAYLLTRSLCTRDFKHTRGDAQRSVSCDNLDTCNPLRQFSSFLWSELCTGIKITTILGVDCVDLVPRAVYERGGGTQVCVEIAVAFENVELVCGFVFFLLYVNDRS
jgi:hypothetical protein